MILGILGKGGSGKTTTATLLSKYISDMGRTVLAIDADHNQDLSYNVGLDNPSTYIGQSLPDLLNYLGYDSTANYRDAISSSRRFSLTEPDAYTQKYAHRVSESLLCMVSGPHTDSVLYDQSCSHALTTPLKLYLPLLETGDGVVVVDEKAGLDGVGTGVTTGFTAAIIAVEPTPHSIKAAKGIADLLEFYETPYRVVATKTTDDTVVRSAFTSKTIGPISLTEPHKNNETLSLLIAFGENLHTAGDTRLLRTKNKILRNNEFQMNH